MKKVDTLNRSMMVANIVAVYNKASAYELKEGEAWYRADAWAFAMNLGWQIAANLGQLLQEMNDKHWSRFAAAVIAVLSPQKEWRVNKALAYTAIQQVLAGQEVTGHYGPQTAKVTKLYRYFLIHRGEAFDNAAVLNIISQAKAKKTRNFYLNIMGNEHVVTVDGHAASIAENGLTRVAITQTSQPDGAKYDAYEAAYVEAAKQLNVTPSVLQATTWVTYRRLDLVTK